MSNTSDILKQLQAAGRRLTKARRAVVSVLASGRPMTADELRRKIARTMPSVHKTTVYREMATLIEEGVLTEVRLGDRSVRYELNDGHHHHVVCTDCGDVQDVELKGDLLKEEQRITRSTGFKILKHSLEFFGQCAECR